MKTILLTTISLATAAAATAVAAEVALVGKVVRRRPDTSYYDQFPTCGVDFDWLYWGVGGYYNGTIKLTTTFSTPLCPSTSSSSSSTTSKITTLHSGVLFLTNSSFNNNNNGFEFSLTGWELNTYASVCVPFLKGYGVGTELLINSTVAGSGGGGGSSASRWNSSAVRSESDKEWVLKGVYRDDLNSPDPSATNITLPPCPLPASNSKPHTSLASNLTPTTLSGNLTTSTTSLVITGSFTGYFDLRDVFLGTFKPASGGDQTAQKGTFMLEFEGIVDEVQSVGLVVVGQEGLRWGGGGEDGRRRRRGSQTAAAVSSGGVVHVGGGFSGVVVGVGVGVLLVL